MKHKIELYQEIFAKLEASYGHSPCPKNMVLKKVVEFWDETLGDYQEEHIMEGLKKCIADHEDKMPRLPKIARYVEDARMEEKARHFANPNYEEEAYLERTPEMEEKYKNMDTKDLLDEMLKKIRGK